MRADLRFWRRIYGLHFRVSFGRVDYKAHEQSWKVQRPVRRILKDCGERRNKSSLQGLRSKRLSAWVFQYDPVADLGEHEKEICMNIPQKLQNHRVNRIYIFQRNL